MVWRLIMIVVFAADFMTGLSERRARAYDGGDLMYKDWTIPAGTFVGMNHYDVAHDEAIFPNSFAYIPERVSVAYEKQSS